MKKTYQKPTLELMAVEQENMMATSSMNIFEQRRERHQRLGISK